jgi:hypothetical protein
MGFCHLNPGDAYIEIPSMVALPEFLTCSKASLAALGLFASFGALKNLDRRLRDEDSEPFRRVVDTSAVILCRLDYVIGILRLIQVLHGAGPYVPNRPLSDIVFAALCNQSPWLQALGHLWIQVYIEFCMCMHRFLYVAPSHF